MERKPALPMTVSLHNKWLLNRPTSVAAAIEARIADPDSRFLAGGTDLLIHLRYGEAKLCKLIDLTTIESLKTMVFGEDSAIIGSGVSIARIAQDRILAENYPALAQAAASVAAPAHRNVATLGGNLCLDTRCIHFDQSETWRMSNADCLKNSGEICHAAPNETRCHAAYSGDLAPALIAIDAQVETESARGARRIALSDLYAEDGRAHLKLEPDEIVTTIYLPARIGPSAYSKLRARGTLDYPLAGVAVVMRMEGGALAALRIALTGLSPRPFLLDGAQGLLGRPVDEETLGAVEKLIMQQAPPMRTTLVAANYRRLAAVAAARRLMTQLAPG
ncbi:MAG: FAD binding domain-containing protein [Rhodoblastus sp.]